MKDLLEQLQKEYKVENEDLNLLQKYVSINSFKKGKTIIASGERNSSLYILKEGVWRAYREYEGEEITLWFAVPGEPVFSSWGFHENAPSRLTIKASCDSVAYKIEKSIVEDIFCNSPELSRWLYSLLTKLLLNTDNFLVDLSMPRATQRYLSLLYKMPHILNHVPLKEIAGYLGVTPQSLSRIRAEVVKKKD